LRLLFQAPVQQGSGS